MTLTEPAPSTKRWERLRDQKSAMLRRSLKGTTKKQRREAIQKAATSTTPGSAEAGR